MSISKISIAAIITLALVAFGLVYSSTSYSTPEISPSILWVMKSNPSDGKDTATASCVVGDYVVVVGDDFSPSSGQFRVEVRSKSNGDIAFYVVKDILNSEESFSDCVTVGGRVFIAGMAILMGVPPKAYMAVLDVGSRDLRVEELGWSGGAAAIEYDGNYIYVGGGDIVNNQFVFRVDKIDPSSLSRIAAYKSESLQGYFSMVISMNVNAKTGHLWLVGLAVNPVSEEIKWWVEVINKGNMKLVKNIDLNITFGAATGVISDAEGNVYIAGFSGDNGVIVKLDSEGRLVKRVEFPGATFAKTLLYEGALLILGHEEVEEYAKHILYILDLDLNLVDKYVLSADIEAYSEFYPGKASVEKDILYAAGTNNKDGDYQWIIYAIALKPTTETTTIPTITGTPTVTGTTWTVTETRTITTTITATKTQTVTETKTNTITQTETRTITTTAAEATKTVTETKTQTVTETKPEVSTTTITMTVTQTLRGLGETKTVTLKETTTITKTITEPRTETITLTIQGSPKTATERETEQTAQPSATTPIALLAASIVILIVLATSIAILLRGRR